VKHLIATFISAALVLPTAACAAKKHDPSWKPKSFVGQLLNKKKTREDVLAFMKGTFPYSLGRTTFSESIRQEFFFDDPFMTVAIIQELLGPENARQLMTAADCSRELEPFVFCDHEFVCPNKSIGRDELNLFRLMSFEKGIAVSGYVSVNLYLNPEAPADEDDLGEFYLEGEGMFFATIIESRLPIVIGMFQVRSNGPYIISDAIRREHIDVLVQASATTFFAPVLPKKNKPAPKLPKESEPALESKVVDSVGKECSITDPNQPSGGEDDVGPVADREPVTPPPTAGLGTKGLFDGNVQYRIFLEPIKGPDGVRLIGIKKHVKHPVSMKINGNSSPTVVGCMEFVKPYGIYKAIDVGGAEFIRKPSDEVADVDEQGPWEIEDDAANPCASADYQFKMSSNPAHTRHHPNDEPPGHFARHSSPGST
jgi:hypothetical protein